MNKKMVEIILEGKTYRVPAFKKKWHWWQRSGWYFTLHDLLEASVCDTCSHWLRGAGCMVPGPVGVLVDCSEVNPDAKQSLYTTEGKHPLEYLGFSKMGKTKGELP